MFSDEIMIKVKQSVQPNNHISQETVDPILKGFFRLNDSEITSQQKAKLSEISDYFGDVDDEMEKVLALKDIRFRMGHPQLGVSELEHFHKYIRLRNSIKDKEVQLKALER